MESFIQRHAANVIGVLRGFDRLLLRGTLRSISYSAGVDKFLGAAKVRYTDFGRFAQELSEELKANAEQLARRAGRPFEYLPNSSTSKEEHALAIAERDGIKEGLICVLRCVEPCITFSIRRDESGDFGLVSQERKCLHLYFYYLDREFGLMHVRLATWLPFGIQVCLNGREYLARRMSREGVGYEQQDNCFVRIDDLGRAQTWLRELEERKWKALLDALARRVNPLVARGHRLGLRGYYWTVRESEYATDIMFSDAAALQRVYPALLDHAIKRFSCADVLRFLGRRTVASRHAGEVSSNMVRRTEGVRVKHRVEENWLKMYDKQGSVLRIETVLNNVRRFKVWRMTTHQGVRRMRWIPMRKGLMDLERRVELSRAANERYLEALAVVQVPCPAKLLLDPVSNGVTKEGRPYRPLRPVSPQDAQVFQAVLQGQFLLRGFSNRDLRQSLNLPHPADAPDTRRHSARITRLLRLLRAHRLVRKVSHTRYYRVTPTGHSVMTAALALRDANLAELVA